MIIKAEGNNNWVKMMMMAKNKNTNFKFNRMLRSTTKHYTHTHIRVVHIFILKYKPKTPLLWMVLTTNLKSYVSWISIPNSKYIATSYNT